MPAVTAVLPTFNRAALLERAVRSVLAQTHREVVALVCDNASPDDTPTALARLAAEDPRVVAHRHARNEGAYYNFQFGVDRVATPYFSILSDDDLLFPDLYRRAVEVLEADRSLGFYAAQVVLYDVVRGTHALRPSKGWSAGRHEAGESARLMTEHHFVWTGCVFRREVRDALGPFETVPMGDILFLGKAAAAFPFFVDLRPGALFSETGSNFSRTLPVGELLRSHAVAKAWAESLPGLTPEDRGAMVEVVSGRLKVMAHGMLRDAAETGDAARFAAVAGYLEGRGDLDARRRRKIAFALGGGWRFRAVCLWTRLQSGYKRRKSSGFRRRTIEEIVAEFTVA